MIGTSDGIRRRDGGVLIRGIVGILTVVTVTVTGLRATDRHGEPVRALAPGAVEP